MSTRSILTAIACAALVACGGGGSGGPVSDPPASAGLWKGTTSTNRTIAAALLSDGTFWVLYTVAGNPNLVAGLDEGTATSIGSAFTSTDTLDFNLEGAGITAAQANATFAPKSTFNGSIRNSAQQTVNFTANFVTAPPAALSQVVGTFRGPSAFVGGSDSATVTINAAGAITGNGATGCVFSGSATPRTDVPVFDITVTFGGGVCSNGTATVKGIAFFDTTTNQLSAAALNSARNNGVIYLGTKQ